VIEARADNPTDERAGVVKFIGAGDRECALVTLAGEMGTAGWPPEWPSKMAQTPDEQDLARYVDELRLDQPGYEELCAEARRIAEDSRFADVVSVAEELMFRGLVLDEDRIGLLCDALASADLATKAAGAVRHKSFGLAKASTSGPIGEFQALVSVFGNVDGGGDRILPGAFTKTLAKWRTSGDPVPVIWSHDWKSPDAHIGVADPHDVVETDRGLLVRGQLDIDDNPTASRVYKLMSRRSLKEFSFGYKVPPGGQRRGKDGRNELVEIDLIEVGPTLKGMNPDTELHGVKGETVPNVDHLPEPAASPELAEVREQAHREMYTLLTGSKPAAQQPANGIGTPRRRSLVDRELRRQCDQIMLEAALGFDTELTKNLRSRRAA
jgi:HK97 family phage prohead protease